MREIKFRALTEEGNIIEDVGSIEFLTDGTIIVNNEIPVKQLIQFMERKDKNGKDIYEDDIVMFMEWNRGYSESYAKENNRDGEHIPKYYHVKEREFFTDSEWGRSSEKCEVVGTFHENPELLTK